MSTPPDMKFELMQSDYSWLDCMADVTKITTTNKIGLYMSPDSIPSWPDVGKLTVTMKDLDGNYIPAANGIGTGRIDNNRRVRIRYSGRTNGKALQTIVTGQGSVGATLNTGATAATSITVDSTRRVAQTFKIVNPGILTSFAPHSTGALSAGALTWELHNYDTTKAGNIGSTVLATGSDALPGGGDDTVTVSSGPYLTYNTNYVFVFIITSIIFTINFDKSTNSVYANGTCLQSTDSGVTWVDQTSDLMLKVTTAASVIYTSQVVTTATSIGNVWTLQWDARAPFDSQYNVDAVRIVTSGETGAVSYSVYTNKWVTYSLTFTATATGTTIEPRFAPQMSATGLNSQAVEYRNITLKKGAGSDVLTNGNFSTGAITPWAVTNSGGNTIAATVINDYHIVFDGKVQDIRPAAQLEHMTPFTTFDAVDHVQQVKDQLATLPLQKSFTSDSLADLALATLPTQTLHTTLPGTVTDAGHSTFPIGGDTWVVTGNSRVSTSVMQIVNQGVLSELGRCWFDRDGTFEVHNRDFVPLRSGVTPKLTLTDGVSGYALSLVRSAAKIRNDIVITSHQRVTGAAAGQIGKMDQQNVFIPGNGSISITLTFKDASGNTIGADSLVALAATTDYLVNYYATNDPSYNSSLNDLTNSALLTVTSTSTASQMVVTFKSSSIAFAGYVTFLQARGLTVTQYNPSTVEVSDATSIAAYEKHPFTVDLPFQVDQQLITNYANYLLSSFKYPFIEVQYFEVQNTTTINSVDVMTLEIGDTVSISDTRSGLSSIIHMITNVEYDWNTDMGNSEPIRCRFYLERMDQVKYWQLGVAGFSELGQTTILFI